MRAASAEAVFRAGSLAESLEPRRLLHADHPTDDAIAESLVTASTSASVADAGAPLALGSAVVADARVLAAPSNALPARHGFAQPSQADGPVYDEIPPERECDSCCLHEPLGGGPESRFAGVEVDARGTSGAADGDAAAPTEADPAPPDRDVAVSGDDATSPRAPGDFVYYRATSLGTDATDGGGSDVNEPSVGTLNHTVFQTGNWYASVSGDNGASFRYVDPYTTFPAAGTGFTAGFCCDQRVTQDEARDMVIWYLQYVKSGSGAGDTGGIRIARATNTPNLLDNIWTYYNFIPASFGYGAGLWMDFPNLEVSNSFLYATSNLFRTTDNGYAASVLWRIGLDELQAGGGIGYQYWNLGGEAFALAPTQNATTTMYFGSIINANTTRLWRVDDASNLLFAADIGGLATTNFATHTSITPSGNNWTGRADSRIQSAYVVGNNVTFHWNSAQGAGRPQPFIRAATIDAANNGVLGQPEIWHPDYAWHYPRFSVNARGHVGGVLTVGGGGWGEPGVQAYIDDDFGRSAAFASNGNASSNNRWGDYLGSQPDDNFPNTWTGVGFHLTGTTAQPHFFWFGRDRDNPLILPSVPDVGDTLVTAAATGIPSWGGTYSAENPIWTPVQGRLDVDIYRVNATARGQLTASTYRSRAGATNMDTMLRLFNSNGVELAIDDDSGPDFYSSLAYTFTAAGTYYVGVSGFQNLGYNPNFAGSGSLGDTGDYGIDITLGDPDVPDTIGSALDLGIAPGSTSVIDPLGNGPFGVRDVDMYRLTATTGARLVLETDVPPGGIDMDTLLRVFNAAGTQLAIDDDAGPGFYSRIEYTVPANGQYFVGVSGFNNGGYNPNVGNSGIDGARGDYVLRAQVQPPTAATVVGRRVFYNNSALDGNNPGAGPADDAAIAPTKQALLAGAPGPANLTSIEQGLNGLMIDVQGLPPGAEAGLTAADFVFRTGNGGSPATWVAAPNPSTVAIRRGAGAAGSDRVTLIWTDATSVKNAWLQLTMLANADTGLAAPDVFYFGNLRGDANNDRTVSVADAGIVATHFGLSNRTPEQGDFSGNRQVTVADVGVLSSNFSLTLGIPTIPIVSGTGGGDGGPFAAAAAAGDPGAGGLATSLTAAPALAQSGSITSRRRLRLR